MRRAYSAQAVSAQAGSLASSATTWSRATFGDLPFRGGLLPGGGFCQRRLVGLHFHFLAAPHLLEVVEAAHGRMHDVHHHVAEVDQHPLAALRALDAVDAPAGLLYLFLHA